jgi:hypothetical protein
VIVAVIGRTAIRPIRGGIVLMTGRQIQARLVTLDQQPAPAGKKALRLG